MRVAAFLLSPANLGGKRAHYLMRESASFELALRVRFGGAPLGEVFSFVSGLYFRGKLAYARAFATGEIRVIAPGLGLVDPDTPIDMAGLRAMSRIGVTADVAAFLAPLERDLRSLAGRVAPDDPVVLLGSVATDKYVAAIQRHLGDRAHFPIDFVGRGDMSRGGLMLRCVTARRELRYVPLAGAVRHGVRPPRLAPIR